MQDGASGSLYTDGRRVVVRAYGGRPLYRILLSYTDVAAFVCAEEYRDAIMAGEHPGPMVGFPMNDVFEFDEGVYAALADQWARQRATDPATWQKLKRYEIRSSRG